MADTESKPDSEVVDALNLLYISCLTAEEQIKRLKVHFKVRFHYCRLVEMLHCMLVCECCHNVKHNGVKVGECVKCWSICVLHKIEGLGGDANSSLMPSIVVTDGVKNAMTTILGKLEGVYFDAQAVIADAKDDHPTAKLAGEIQCAAGKHIECVKAHLRQIEDLGANYLVTLV
jgi:hypothetical protein